jgi:RNA polymerase sigma factor (sigma-70 family)
MSAGGGFMDDLSELVRRSQRGELDAYDRIVRRFQDMAVGYGYSLLHDLHWAEDAAQEAFVQAYLDLPTLNNTVGFPSWFRKIVFKQCDRLTRRKQISTVSLEVAQEVVCPASGPARAVEDAEQRASLRAEIQKLPASEREVITLFYIGGYSQEELCCFLDVPVTTIKKRLQTARRRLRERMMADVEGDLQNQAPSRTTRFADEIAEALRESHAPNPDHDTTRMVWVKMYVALDEAASAGRPVTGGQRAVFNALLADTKRQWPDDLVLQAIPEARRNDTAEGLRLSAGVANHATCRGAILDYANVQREMRSFCRDLTKIVHAQPDMPAPDNVVTIFNTLLTILKSKHRDDLALQATSPATRRQPGHAILTASDLLLHVMEEEYKRMTDAQREEPW